MWSIVRLPGAAPRSNAARASGWVLPVRVTSGDSFTGCLMSGWTPFDCAETAAAKGEKKAKIATNESFLFGSRMSVIPSDNHRVPKSMDLISAVPDKNLAEVNCPFEQANRMAKACRKTRCTHGFEFPTHSGTAPQITLIEPRIGRGVASRGRNFNSTVRNRTPESTGPMDAGLAGHPRPVYKASNGRSKWQGGTSTKNQVLRVSGGGSV
jgi:hypothetical protein